MLREGAMALGASKWKTIATVIVPAAYRGIMTAILLALARVAGEKTAPLLFTAFGNRFESHGWSQPTATLPVMIYTYAVSPYDDWHRQAWAAGLVLLGLVLIINILARTILSRGIAGTEVLNASVRKAGVSVNIVTNLTTPASRETAAALPLRMTISKLNFFYGPKQILFDINMGIADKRVTALIGPSGCGKSTLLRTMNRMHETVSTARLDGEILLDSQNILAQDVTALRRRVGMVFQRPNPFPKSIYDNVAYGLRINGYKGPWRIR